MLAAHVATLAAAPVVAPVHGRGPRSRVNPARVRRGAGSARAGTIRVRRRSGSIGSRLVRVPARSQ